MPAHVDGRLATHTAARQLNNIDRADALAASVAAVVDRSYRRLVAWLRTGPGIEDVHRRIDLELTQLARDVRGTLRAGLRREAELAWGSAISAWVDSLEPEQWAALLNERGRRWGELPSLEKLDPPGTVIPTEQEIMDLIRQGKIQVRPRPALSAAITVFPPPPAARIERIVFAGQWDARIERLSRLAPPKLVADSLIDGIAAGENPRQLEKRLRPLLQNNRTSAMRVARTESIRVAETMQREQYMSVDSVIGAQILSVLGETTRPHHAARHGTIYYKPGRGSPTTDTMPLLPDEPNCLCWSSPVFDEPDISQAGIAGPEFDPVSMQKTFDGWTDRQRKSFVGAGRYKVVADKLAGVRRPQFADFVAPKTGRLLPTQHLRGEELWRLDQRSAVVREIIARRARDIETARVSAVSKRGAFVQPTPQQVDDLIAATKQQTDDALVAVKPQPTQPAQAVASQDPGPELRRQLLASAAEDQAALDAAEARVVEAKARYESVRAQDDKWPLIREYTAARDARDALLSARLARFAPILRSPSSTARTLPVSIRGKQAAAIRAGSEAFRAVLSRPGLNVSKKIVATSKPGNRGDYSAARARLRVGARSDAAWAERTAVHEWGHWLEDTADPRVAKAAKEFLARRTAGEQAQRLSRLQPGRGYGASEIAKPDRFISPYMGKVYGHGSTELVSMGVEYYVYDPVLLATKDPEYFDWIVRILRGLEP